MYSSSKETLAPARYVLETEIGTSCGSFNELERANEYSQSLLRLRGVKTTVVDTQCEPSLQDSVK